MERFRIGAVIRRNSEYGPIGPYMRITVIENDRIYADTIGADNPNIMLLKSNVYVCSMYSLVVSEPVLKRLQEGLMSHVQHPQDTKWNRVVDNKPELVRFYSKVKGYEVIFKLWNAYKTHVLGDDVVYVYLNEKIL